MERRLSAEYGPVRRVPIILERGQVSFHNCLSIHASDVNVSKSPRLSLALHMQDDSNRYRVFLNDKGIPWQLANDRLCRSAPDGTPDYTDPAVFPTLWDERNEIPREDNTYSDLDLRGRESHAVSHNLR